MNRFGRGGRASADDRLAQPVGKEVGLRAPSQQADNEGVQTLLFAFGFQSQFSV